MNKLTFKTWMLVASGITIGLTACSTKEAQHADSSAQATTSEKVATEAGSSNGVDSIIADYEKMAVDYKDVMARVKKGDAKAMQEMQGFSQKMMDVNRKIQERVEKEGLKLTPEQEARLKKVGENFNQSAGM